MLVRNTQVMHAVISEHVTPYNDALRNPIVSGIWNMATEMGRSALNGEITRQATIIAYNNDFKLIMIVALAALPLLFLLRRAGERPAAAGAILE